MSGTTLELVSLDVPPGVAMESQSGLQMGRPRIYGALAGPPAAPDGVIVMHPASNFMGHYLIEPLAARGLAVLALNSRYVNNDTTLIMERVIQDLGAGVRFMRRRGVRRLVLVGNSGGAGLVCFYQAQAEHLTVVDTPAGDPVGLEPNQLPPADGIALAAAHPGRAQLLTSWLDASMVDEADPLAADPTWDIYDPAQHVPFAASFVQELRARQRLRSRSITARARVRLDQLRARPDGPTDAPLVVHRTYADPRLVDLSLDANDREPGGTRGQPRAVNYGPNGLGRFSTLTSWLSQWSLESRANGPADLAATGVPAESGPWYGHPVSSAGSGRRFGRVFDTVAVQYDAHRPTYPDELVERACDGLAAGDPVLEVGCGSGQLTRSLARRGLEVTAVDPGSRLLAVAARGIGGVRFVNAPFETAELATDSFRGVFSAAAFHWVDPDLSWARAADVLSPGGTLALLQHCGVAADDDQEALMAAVGRAAPEVAARWPVLRPLDVILAGIEERAANVSEAWSWVGQYELGRPAAGRLFSDVQAAGSPVVMEQTAEQLLALLRTLSPYHRMTPDQQAGLQAAVTALGAQLGRPFRSTTAAVLVTARKAGG